MAGTATVEAAQGERTSRNGKPIALSFNDLQSRTQSYLMNWSPDPDALSDGDVRAFAKEFLEMYPELRDAIKPENVVLVRRLMRSARTARQAAQAKRDLARRR